MNEEIILSMVQPYVKDESVTYTQFDSIFDMLSLKEQYTVSEILYRNGINLVDEHEGYILETDDDLEEDTVEDFPILYDEGFFKDSHYAEGDKENIIINRNIKQSNEILCSLIQQGNRQATQDLCVKNKRLVDKYVIDYQKRYGNRLDFEDLEQVGFIGLIKAARKYDNNQGSVFSTYAVCWIKQAISREIMDNGYAIRIPVHMMEHINRVVRTENQYIELGIEERIEKISKELSMSEERVRECLILKKNYLGYVSLNAPIRDEEDIELGELIPEEEIMTVEDIVADRELKHVLQMVVSTLTQREQKVLRLRFGLDDEQSRTLEEVGRIFNVTRERIRQIEAKALRKLRHPSRSRKLKDYLD